jgi:hypothetical protein
VPPKVKKFVKECDIAIAALHKKTTSPASKQLVNNIIVRYNNYFINSTNNFEIQLLRSAEPSPLLVSSTKTIFLLLEILKQL